MTNKYAITDEQVKYLRSIEDEYIKGFDALNQLGDKPALTVYGSARLPFSDKDYKEIVEVGKLARSKGWAVVTGGGPGIMSAALTDDNNDIVDTVAYNITIPGEEEKSPADISMTFDHFSVRKYLLRRSKAFLVAPGGYGTMDELMELVTLIKTDKCPSVPVLLYNESFWKGLVDWFTQTLIPKGTIDESHVELLQFVNSPEEVIEKISGIK